MHTMLSAFAPRTSTTAAAASSSAAAGADSASSSGAPARKEVAAPPATFVSPRDGAVLGLPRFPSRDNSAASAVIDFDLYLSSQSGYSGVSSSASGSGCSSSSSSNDDDELPGFLSGDELADDFEAEALRGRARAHTDLADLEPDRRAYAHDADEDEDENEGPSDEDIERELDAVARRANARHEGLNTVSPRSPGPVTPPTYYTPPTPMLAPYTAASAPIPSQEALADFFMSLSEQIRHRSSDSSGMTRDHLASLIAGTVPFTHIPKGKHYDGTSAKKKKSTGHSTASAKKLTGAKRARGGSGGPKSPAASASASGRGNGTSKAKAKGRRKRTDRGKRKPPSASQVYRDHAKAKFTAWVEQSRLLRAENTALRERLRFAAPCTLLSAPPTHTDVVSRPRRNKTVPYREGETRADRNRRAARRSREAAKARVQTLRAEIAALQDDNVLVRRLLAEAGVSALDVARAPDAGTLVGEARASSPSGAASTMAQSKPKERKPSRTSTGNATATPSTTATAEALPATSSSESAAAAAIVKGGVGLALANNKRQRLAAGSSLLGHHGNPLGIFGMVIAVVGVAVLGLGLCMDGGSVAAGFETAVGGASRRSMSMGRGLFGVGANDTQHEFDGATTTGPGGFPFWPSVVCAASAVAAGSLWPRSSGKESEAVEEQEKEEEVNDDENSAQRLYNPLD